MPGEHSAGGLTRVSGFLASAWKPPITYLSPYRKKIHGRTQVVVSKLDFAFSKDTSPIHSIICFIPATCPSPFQGTALWTLKQGCSISPDVSSPAEFFQFLPLFLIYPWNWFELLHHPGQCPGHTCFSIKDSVPNWTKWSRQEVWSFSLSG